MNDCDIYKLLPHYSLQANRLLFLNKIITHTVLSKKISDVLQRTILLNSKLFFDKDQDVFRQLINEGVLVHVEPVGLVKNSKNGCSLFIQAHSDDCALSCGGTIAHACLKDNHHIVLATVFSDYATDYFPWQRVIGLDNQEYSILRKREDELAIEYLYGDVEFFDIAEALLRGLKTTTFKKGILREDQKLIDVIYEKILLLVEKYKPQNIYFPLAIGWHCDHQILYLTAEKLIRRHNDLKFKIFFYEDYPYCDENKDDNLCRLTSIREKIDIQPDYIDITDFLAIKSTLVNFYKSQFINWTYEAIQQQMLELANATVIESKMWHNQNVGFDFAERIWKIF